MTLTLQMKHNSFCTTLKIFDLCNKYTFTYLIFQLTLSKLKSFYFKRKIYITTINEKLAITFTKVMFDGQAVHFYNNN